MFPVPYPRDVRLVRSYQSHCTITISHSWTSGSLTHLCKQNVITMMVSVHQTFANNDLYVVLCGDINAYNVDMLS